MFQDTHAERLFETLITGNRVEARAVVAAHAQDHPNPADTLIELFWPTYEAIEKLHRSDKIEMLGYRFATRLLRVLVDQNATRLGRTSDDTRSVLAVAGPTDPDELGAQMAVDLLEARGLDVRFPGGGIATDEVVAYTQQSKPDILAFFASAPGDLPGVRSAIDTLHSIGACPHLQIAVGGGVFNRVDGLAEEIGADLWASNPLELAERVVEEPERRADLSNRTVGRSRQRVAA
ncbi:MAG: cobalamin B12-binding domain-containing protein [Planctomycetota bacterium]